MEKTNENIKRIFESKAFFKTILVIGIVLVALIIFSAGVTVGFHKASYKENWEEHYEENFGMGQRGFMGGMMDKGVMMGYFPNAHGAIGKILKIELPNIIVQDKDGTEKVILTNADTKIQKSNVAITVNDLKVDDYMVVIGTPNDKGVIEAKFIRVIPSPEFLK